MLQEDYETTLDNADFENIGKIPELGEAGADVLEKQGSHYFEGDIKLPPSDAPPGVLRDSIFSLFPIVSRFSLWEDGEVPYTISSRYTRYQRARIAEAMQDYERLTCIKFKGRTNERDYVYIFKDDGCYSLVGRVGGRQELSLDDDCVRKGEGKFDCFIGTLNLRFRRS